MLARTLLRLSHTASLSVATTGPFSARAMSASASASNAGALPASFTLDARSHSALSHALSKVLRHTAPSLGLSLDSAGYARVDDLLALPTFRRLTPQPNLQSLQFVAAHCPKQRFGLVHDNNEWKIRANQGHNAAFAGKLDAAALLEPLQIGGPLPAVCIHGTTRTGWAAISASGGLHPMGRSHIHFSSKEFGAADLVSGMRNSSEILIALDLSRCLSWAASSQVKARNGELQFFRSANDVVLTAGVSGLSGYLPSFLFERVEEVSGSGPAANKQRRELAGWQRPTEEQWMAQFAHSLAPPAAAEAAAAPRRGARVVPDLSSASEAARPSRWGPPPTSRPPANWVVPAHLAHIAEAIAAEPAKPAVAASAFATSSAAGAGAASAARPAAATSQPFEYLVVLDFEATCDESSNGSRFGPQEVIEFPLVVIEVATGETKAIFRRYVTPQVHPKLTAFCTGLTGITNAMVAPESGALPFGTVWTQVEAFLREQNLLPPLTSSSASSPSTASTAPPHRWAFVTCGDWDLRTMLPAQLSLLGVKKHEIPLHYTGWINLKPTFNSFYQPRIDARGMTDMLNKLNLPLVGRHHSGLDDCKNIAQIVCRMIDDGCTFKLTQQHRRDKAAAAHAAQERDGGAPAAASVVSFAAQPQPAAASAPAASSARGPSALQSALLRGANQSSRFQ